MDQWDSVMAVNLRGLFVCCHAVLPQMVDRGKGVIINVGSSSARMAEGDYGAYTASKWGVAGYTGSLATSVRPLGIRGQRHQPRVGGHRHGAGH